MAQDFRITYATLSADNEELQRNYDEAVERARAELGKEWPFVVNGEERWTEEKYEEPSPIDSDIIIGRFSQATPKDVDDAVAEVTLVNTGWLGYARTSPEPLRAYALINGAACLLTGEHPVP